MPGKMSKLIDEFNAIFLGGLGTNGQIKESWCKVRVLANGESEFKFLGNPFSRWNKLIYDLNNTDKFPYSLRDIFLGGDKCQMFRQYNHSIKLEPHIETLEQSSLRIRNKQLSMNVLVLQEKLATVQKHLKDMNFDDRRKKDEIEQAKHYKSVRSNMLYNEQIGSGIY